MTDLVLSVTFLTVFRVTIQRRQWHPTPVLLPGKSHGRRSLVGCSPWGHWESDTTEWLHFHALEKEMATHSSVLASRIPWTGEPDGLLSMGSHRVGHDWSDLAAAEWPLGARWNIIIKFLINSRVLPLTILLCSFATCLRGFSFFFFFFYKGKDILAYKFRWIPLLDGLRIFPAVVSRLRSL